MKKLYLLVIGMITISTSLFSQNINVNPGAGSYPTLKDAFDAINAGTHTGVITIDVVGNTAETLSAVLNASGTGAASYTSIVISPSGGASRTISGAIAGPLVDFNGADNVTIDGLNSGGNFLFIDNSNGGTGTSTVRFIGDASNNTITRTNVLGSAGTLGTTGLGVIFFSTGTITGNDNNTISNCNISPSFTGNPIYAIYSLGTSAAIDNSNNTLSVNNIADYFNAGASSSGININSNNSAWTINSNSLYQTANRVYTTASTHNGIVITSGSGYTITNNIIGYANPASTGTTNMMGLTTGALGGTFPSAYTTGGTPNATRYVAINCAFTAGGTVSSIQNNRVGGFALYTSSGAATTFGVFCGIAVTSGNVNIGTVTGNTIGSTTGNGSIYTACTTTGGMVAGIYVTSTNAVAIRNNTIGAIDAMGTTASICGGFNGINIAGTMTSYDVSGNTIGNSTAPNLRMGNLTTGANLSNVGTTFGAATGVGTFNGILSTQTGAGTIGTAALPNIIRNGTINSSNTGTASSIRGITASGIPTISYNTISNLAAQSANTALGTTFLAGMGIYLNSISSNGAVVSYNTINSISLTNPVTTGTNVAGIAVYAGTTTINNNKIYDLRNASTSTTPATPGTASGIFLRQPSGVQTIYNNMISLGNGQTTNTAFNGIWMQNSAIAYTLNAYYNSINIEGIPSAGAQPSFCFNRGSYSATTVTTPLNILNNIFTNTRSGGTGQHFAIGNCYGATAVNTGWPANASNNNVLNANAATVGYWTTAQAFAGWQTASASDALSISGVTVSYVNTPTADLHLNMGVTPTQIESGGIAIAGITTDYDNDVRPGPTGSVNGGATAPDMGADEFDGVPLDLFSPTITYSTLLNTTCTTNRGFTVSASDNSGVNVTVGTRPRVYYKRSTDGNTWNDNTNATDGWKYAEASNATSPFNFIIDYSLLNGGTGVSLGNIVQYFVVAQDLSGTPNVGINTGTFSATPSTVVLTATAFPIGGFINQYNIVAGLATTITVGAVGDYPFLSGTGGLFSAINANGLTGNTTVNILDASITEPGTFALNQIQSGDCSASAYSLLIKPNVGVTSTLTGTINNNALIRILSSNVTIDGSNNGTTSRDLTMTNTSITSPSVLLLASVGTTPIVNSTIRNSLIINGAQTATALVVSDQILGTAGYFNNITIQNNDIRQAFIGNYNIAVPIAGNGSGLNISNNMLNSSWCYSFKKSRYLCTRCRWGYS